MHDGTQHPERRTLRAIPGLLATPALRSPASPQERSGIRLRALLIVCSLLWTACAGTQEGDACTSERFACEDVDAALECRDGRWVRIPCRGPAGCESAGDAVTCDLSANEEGDRCPLNAYGQGRCADGGQALLECRQGQMVKTRDCAACEVAEDLVVCTPP